MQKTTSKNAQPAENARRKVSRVNYTTNRNLDMKRYIDNEYPSTERTTRIKKSIEEE